MEKLESANEKYGYIRLSMNVSDLDIYISLSEFEWFCDQKYFWLSLSRDEDEAKGKQVLD